MDPKTSTEIMEILDRLNKEYETTVVMVTHDKDIVNRMKKRVISLDNGVLIGDKVKGSYKVRENI